MWNPVLLVFIKGRDPVQAVGGLKTEQISFFHVLTYYCNYTTINIIVIQIQTHKQLHIHPATKYLALPHLVGAKHPFNIYLYFFKKSI